MSPVSSRSVLTACACVACVACVACSQVIPHKDAAGKIDGLIKEVGQTKVDRTQVGERKALRCRSDCDGKLAVGADGMVDGARACPVELLLESKALIEKTLGLKPGNSYLPRARSSNFCATRVFI